MDTGSDGKPAIVFRSYWKMDDDLDPNWGYGSVKYAVMIEGVPSMRLESSQLRSTRQEIRDTGGVSSPR